MIARAAVFSVIFAAIVGIAVGVLSPGTPARASVATAFNFYPPIDYGSAQNSCGWHTDCEGTANYARGLDFVSNYSPSTAMFYAWGVSGDLSPTARGHAVVGHTKPVGQSICPATSIGIYDSSWNFQVIVYAMHSSPSVYQDGNTFPVYANNLSYGGYWNAQTVGSYDGSACGGATHIMSWFDYNATSHDPYSSCSSPHSSFYYGCFTERGQYTLPHDLNDWTYYSSWTTPS